MEKYSNLIRKFVSLPMVFGVFGVAFVLMALIYLSLFFGLTPPPAPGAPTALLTIIPGSTATPYVPTSTPTIVYSPTPNLPPSPIPGMLGIGAYVQIYGTDGAALNIRHSPGLSSGVDFYAYDAEVFIVADGPVEMDGFIWWYLVTPVDQSRSGWGAANFLSVIPTP